MCAVHGRRPGFDAAARAGWTGLDDGRRGCPATGARRARSDGRTRARGCPGKEARWGWQGRDGRARAGASQRPGRAQGHGTATMGRHVSIQCAGFVVRGSFIFDTLAGERQPGDCQDVVRDRQPSASFAFATVYRVPRAGSRDSEGCVHEDATRKTSFCEGGGWLGTHLKAKVKALDPSCGPRPRPRGLRAGLNEVGGSDSLPSLCTMLDSSHLVSIIPGQDPGMKILYGKRTCAKRRDCAANLPSLGVWCAPSRPGLLGQATRPWHWQSHLMCRWSERRSIVAS